MVEAQLSEALPDFGLDISVLPHGQTIVTHLGSVRTVVAMHDTEQLDPPAPLDGSVVDVLVVGGSIAGLTAAVVLGRACRSVLVVDAGHPMNEAVAHSQGFPSRDGIAPGELTALVRAEAEGYGVRAVDGKVTSIVAVPNPAPGLEHFAATLADGTVVGARRVLLATGGWFPLPDLPGLAEVWGTDAANCPYCHGWELRDRPLAILGDPVRTAHLAPVLTQWSKDVVAFVPADAEGDATGISLAKARRAGVVVDHRAPVRVVLDDEGGLAGIEVEGGDVVAARGLFVSATIQPHNELAVALGAEIDPIGAIVADREGVTSVPGLYAAGQSTDGTHQLTGAADAGTRAARMLNFDLFDDDLDAR